MVLTNQTFRSIKTILINNNGIYTMEYQRQDSLSALKTLVSHSGGTLDNSDLDIFEKSPEESEPFGERISVIYNLVFQGFFT